MAVMATQQPEGVAFEQKTMPVPSAEKMALDINGNSNRDATLDLDPTTTSSDLVPNTIAHSPLPSNNELTSSTTTAAAAVELNGAAKNIHSVTSNQTITAPSIDVTMESQATQDSSPSMEKVNSPPLPSTNTTVSDILQLSSEAEDIAMLPSDEVEVALAPVFEPATEMVIRSASEDAPAPSTVSPLVESASEMVIHSDAPATSPAPQAIQSAAEMVINSALEDTTTTSTVPPVVEGQESDLRHTTSPLALASASAQQDTQQPANVETEPGLPIDNMDDAMATSDTQNLTLNNSMAYHSALPVSDAPPPANTTAPIQDEPSTAVGQDTEMADAVESAPFAKVPRQREGDDNDEPSAKRTKTDDDDGTIMADNSDVNLHTAPEFSPAAAQTDNAASATSSETTITTYETKELIKILKNMARTKDGKNFSKPVGELWPALTEAYAAKIPQPIDLLAMETKLRGSKYPTMDAFKEDIDLLVYNAVLFNGEENPVTASSKLVRDSLFKKIGGIPPEPSQVPKAPKKQASKSTPVGESAPRTTAPRRQSRSGDGISMAPAPASAQAFALDPTTNTPLIRRDSTKGDGGRPKREIHPPKNKDLPYTTSRPKNKKVALELKFCEEVLAELRKPKHHQINTPFLAAVDPVSLGIPNYFSIIKHPMDMGLIAKKLRDGAYEGAKQFQGDMKLMFGNCYKFNPPMNAVHVCGKQLEALFNELYSKKQQWLAEHAPAAQTPSSNGGSDDEESEEEEEVEEPALGPDAVAQLTERLNEEQDKMITLMSAPGKPNVQLMEMQKDMIDLIKSKIAAAKAYHLQPAKKTVKKSKAPKVAKKQATAKKPTTKKSAPARQKYLGTHEKNVISLGIQRLPEEIVKEILSMIKGETDVDEGDDGEVELDIDVVSPASLWKIYQFVMKYAPETEAEAKAMMDEKEEDAPRSSLAKPPAKKKNKPMSKSEQERKIQQLEKSVQVFDRAQSGSQEPLPTVETHQAPGDETSGDEDSDSEEE